MTRVCKRCGGEIPDLSDHPAARLCPHCRGYMQNPHQLDADRYGPAFRAYLDEHGWPPFATAGKLIDQYPDLLADEGLQSESRRRQVVGVCLRTVHDAEGRMYLPYNNTQFKLSPPDEAPQKQEATA